MKEGASKHGCVSTSHLFGVLSRERMQARYPCRAMPYSRQAPRESAVSTEGPFLF